MCYRGYAMKEAQPTYAQPPFCSISSESYPPVHSLRRKHDTAEKTKQPHNSRSRDLENRRKFVMLQKLSCVDDRREADRNRNDMYIRN